MKIRENARKRKNASKHARTNVCLSHFSRRDGGKKSPHDLALYCNGWLYSHRKQGEREAATEAQFTSTFSNRVFSRSKPVTMACDDGKRKFNLSLFQRRPRWVLPMPGKGWNPGWKWSGGRGRSALYCMQCNGCALTQREGAIFSMLVDEDERPLGAHRNQVSSTARS